MIFFLLYATLLPGDLFNVAWTDRQADKPKTIELSHHFWQGSNNKAMHAFFCLFCCFMSQSTAMVMLGRSVHLTTFFYWASLNKRLTSTLCTYFHLLLTTTFLE